MQKLIIIFLIITYSFSAKVDTKLYEGESIVQYLLNVEKEINSTIVQKLKTPQTIKHERSTLEKIKKLYSVKDEPEAGAHPPL